MFGLDLIFQSVVIEMPLFYWFSLLMFCFFGVIQVIRMWWWIYCNSGVHTPMLL
jgi:hypothetical protein